MTGKRAGRHRAVVGAHLLDQGVLEVGRVEVGHR